MECDAAYTNVVFSYKLIIWRSDVLQKSVLFFYPRKRDCFHLQQRMEEQLWLSTSVTSAQ